MNSRSGNCRTSGSARRKTPAEAAPRPVVQQAFVRLCAVGTILVLAAVIFANSMTKDVGRDEQMYCTAGALLTQGKMVYRDFSYPSQLPYHPLLLSICYKVLGTTHYLFVGRLVSAVSDILVVLGIVVIYRSIFTPRRTEGLLFGLAAAVLYVFNPFVDYAAGYAWNHDVVILLVVTALGLLLTTNFQSPTRWRIGLIGVLLTAATCMRVTTALVEIVFLGAILWMAMGSLRNKVRAALPFLVGTLVMLAWPAWVIVQAPEAFWLNLVRIPTLYGRWLHEIGMTLDKAALTATAILTPACLILLILAAGLFWAGWRRRENLDVHERRKAVVAALLPLVFILIAYIPPTMWLQYLAVPIPFLAVAIAYPLAATRRLASPRDLARRVATCAVPAATLVSIILDSVLGPMALSRSAFVFVPEKWEPVRVHQISRTMLEQAKEPKRVLTLGPLYALEAGCEVYPELSSGSIVYRIADRMTTEERRITHTVGPQTLGAMLANRPAAAVVVGVEPEKFSSLEEPLRQTVPPDWSRISVKPLQACLRP